VRPASSRVKAALAALTITPAVIILFRLMTRSENVDRPLIVQSDRSILVEVASPRYPEARDMLARFAELVKSPEHIHTYRITPLSIWNACAAGESAEGIRAGLSALSKYPVPEHILTEIGDYAGRYGRLVLARGPGGAADRMVLRSLDRELAREIASHPHTAPFLGPRSESEFDVDPRDRGRLKLALIKIGFPVDDRAGYAEGAPLAFSLRTSSRSGLEFSARKYQSSAAAAFHARGSETGGSGVVVLPCGAGKTIVGILCMDLLQTSTLILTTCVTAVRQFISEILDKTDIPEEMIGEYTGFRKEVRPVTVSTYQIMTHRGRDSGEYTHLELFGRENWGLIVYDEVHLLPAPVFQITAGLQARRRLGLTATLVREDGKEDDVFALIGPKKFDVPWKEMEKQGWIAKALCTEVRVPLPPDRRAAYSTADVRSKFRLASENPAKTGLVKEILERHPGEPALVIGMYLDQLKAIASPLGLPVITGATPQRIRDALYADFKSGKIRILAVSKVANFAVDLPDASVAIQISGTFGSRQEEAQRLGRILRPKRGSLQASFYSLVSQDTVEQDFALKRQLFLCEQGYSYAIRDALPALTMGSPR
jgi:DNA excision repair protein ERCC-3